MTDASVTDTPAVTAPVAVAVSPEPTSAPTQATAPAPIAEQNVNVPDQSLTITPATKRYPDAKTAAEPAVSVKTEPAIEPAKVEAPKAETPPADKPSLLAQEDKPAPAEAAPATTEAPAEAAPLPTYDLKFPEGVQAGEKEVGQYTSALGEFEQALIKDPTQAHAKTQELGQRLVDMHVAELTNLKTKLEQNQREVFARTKEEWVEQGKADPEIGGDKFMPTIGRAINLIKEYGGTDSQLAELRSALTFTGMGDHPAMIRFLNKISTALSEGKPIPAPSPKADIKPMKRSERRYGGTR